VFGWCRLVTTLQKVSETTHLKIGRERRENIAPFSKHRLLIFNDYKLLVKKVMVHLAQNRLGDKS
jgi:hypothetical protein